MQAKGYCRCGCGTAVNSTWSKGHHFRRDPTERFWEKVEKTAGCWLWTGAKDGCGYGTFWTGEKGAKAHRVAYEWAHEPIGPGLEIDHLCRTPACVNPDHMEPVTHHENVMRGNAPAAQQARQTHCRNGHPLSGDNLIRHGRSRRCRICTRAGQRVAARRRYAAARSAAQPLP